MRKDSVVREAGQAVKRSGPERAGARQRICRAYISLYRQMPAERITVCALCRKAGTARTTFYAYFGNTGDVREAIEDYLIAGLKKLDWKLFGFALRRESCREFVDGSLDFIEENYEAFAALMADRPSGRFMEKWKNVIQEHYRLIMNSPQEGGLSRVRMEMASTAMLTGCSHWLMKYHRREEVDVDEIARSVLAMMEFVNSGNVRKFPVGT